MHAHSSSVRSIRQVSVFETNIRVIGGLLSAHVLAAHVPGLYLHKETHNQHSPSQSYQQRLHYSGGLLDLAVALADRLMPAFSSSTGTGTMVGGILTRLSEERLVGKSETGGVQARVLLPN